MPLERLTELAAASGGILYLMPVMLLIALTVSFERTWYFTGMLGRCRSVMAGLSPLDRLDREFLGAQIARLREGPVVRLLRVALDAPEMSEPTLLKHRFEEAFLREMPGLDRSLWLLDTIVTLAPLLGLLGTIIGMFKAFEVLGKPGAAPTEITGGVAEALIATGAGIFVAIVGIVFFNSLQTRLRLQVHELETLKTMLVNRIADDAGSPGHALSASPALIPAASDAGD